MMLLYDFTPRISSYFGFTAYTLTRSCIFNAAASMRPPYCWRGVAPTIANERGLSIVCIDAIWSLLQISISYYSTKKCLLQRIRRLDLTISQVTGSERQGAIGSAL